MITTDELHAFVIGINREETMSVKEAVEKKTTVVVIKRK